MEALALAALGLMTGAVGSVLGIGGGILLVPALTLGLGMPMSAAVPVSLLCVVANSLAAAARYVPARLSDVRLAMVLELATVGGAIAGGMVAGFIATPYVAVGFGIFAVVVSLQLMLGVHSARESTGEIRVVAGLPGSFLAGGVSALLGVGGGPVKVPVMTMLMGVPLRVATATSSLMMGITAAVSALTYGLRGELHVAIAAPVIVGALVGSEAGSRILTSVKTDLLRRAFGLVLLGVAVQMVWEGGLSLWTSG